MSTSSDASCRVYESVLELIGETHLIEIQRLEQGADRAQVYGKLEASNPAGSVKDRICLAMIRDAERRGLLSPGGTIIEPTSGNTGIGLSLVAVQRGYRCILTMPESMSLERRQLLESYGAEIVLTPAEQQMQGAIEKAESLLEATPGAFMPQQFVNSSNPEIHYATTGEEILRALGRPPDAFVASVGTGGTITGVGRRLKEASSRCRVVAVEPESCATISRGERGPSRIQGIAAGFVPDNYDPSVPTEVRTITDERAWCTKCALGTEEGLLVGISAGANVAVALDVARELGPQATVVTILCDTGERYFSLGELFDA